MEDFLDFLPKSVEDYAASRHLQSYLLELIEQLYKDLENERISNVNLRQVIQDMTKKDDFGITSKFADLQATYNELRKKVAGLKNENDDLNIQLIAKEEETKRLVAENEDKMKSFYQNQLKHKEEVMKQKDKEVETSKETYKQKEQKFYNDIQAVEAAAAIELDKAETNFRKQLTEANKKLKESMDTVNLLRKELMSVKEQFVDYKRNSDQKIADLHKRLRNSQNFETMSVPIAGLETSNVSGVNLEDKANKYRPLDISYKNSFVMEDRPINLKKVPVYRGSTNSMPVKNTLPSLINLSDKPTSKRRRLFNPEDLSYLHSDGQGDN